MSLRCAQAAGLALAALAVALTCALGPTAARAETAPTSAFVLLGQSPWTSPERPTLTLDLGGAASGDSLVVTVYKRLTSRSAFEATLASPPTSGVLSRTAAVPVAGLAPVAGGVELPLAVSTAGATAATTAGIDLDCTTGSCSGVYPLVISLETAAGSPAATLTTYLTYAESAASTPLRVAAVLPVSSPVVPVRGATQAAAVAEPLGRAGVAGVAAQVQALTDHSTVPVTLDVVPRTLQALAHEPGPAARAVVGQIQALAEDPAVHQVLAAPYVPVDATALTGAGLAGELNAQMVRGQAVFTLDHVEADTGPRVWVATGPVGATLGRALLTVGASRVVVPDTDLAPTTAANLTWSQPFSLALGHGQQAEAAASDSELTAHFTDDPGDPVLEANQLLADLAFIHYEAPGAASVRGVVVVPPTGWTPDPAFVATLLAGLDANPNLTAVTLNGFFQQVPAGANGMADTRSLAGNGPALPAVLAQSVAAGRVRLSAFDGAVQGAPLLLGQLDDALLTSEAATLRTVQQAQMVASFERSLGGQLALIQLATDRTITLTSRTGTIPVTVLSSAPYTVVGTLSVSSDKLRFPSAAATRQAVVIDHPTNAYRFGVVTRTSGDFPLLVTLTAPHGGLVMAQGELQIRSTATSIAGIVLTLAAAVVLLGWWARTWRSTRRARRSGGAEHAGP